MRPLSLDLRERILVATTKRRAPAKSFLDESGAKNLTRLFACASQY